MIIEGRSIFLQPMEISDVSDRYLSWLNDPEVMKGIATNGYTMEILRNYVSSRIATPMTSFNKIIWKKNGLHIGNIKLDFHDPKSNISELGLLIGDKNFWGKGVGSEACSLMINYGFSEQNLSKIWLAVYGNNISAISLYKKLGFVTEGVLKSHVYSEGKVQDKYLMAIFNPEKI